MPFEVGELVADRYEVQATLGRRPLDTLYRARDREVGVEVALRVIAPELLPDEAARRALVRWGERARTFAHPNLVRIFAVRPAGEDILAVVQWAPGRTLEEQARVFSPEEARPLLTQIAAALSYAHQRGVVFGDVQAGSVLLFGSAVKLADLGLGLALPRDRFLEVIGAGQHAALAPEVARGAAVDLRADVYSLGMLAVQLLTGGTDPAALSDPALAGALQRALAADPLARQGSVEALATELDSHLGGPPPRPRRSTPPPPAPPQEDEAPDASQEPTRVMAEEELSLLRDADRITRPVPQAELFPFRVASSDLDEELLLERQAASPEQQAEPLAAPPKPEDTAGGEAPQQASAEISMAAAGDAVNVPIAIDGAESSSDPEEALPAPLPPLYDLSDERAATRAESPVARRGALPEEEAVPEPVPAEPLPREPAAPRPVAATGSRRHRRNPFEPVSPSGAAESAAPDRRRPRETLVVPPLGARRSSSGTMLAIALFASVVAVLGALAIAHFVKQERKATPVVVPPPPAPVVTPADAAPAAAITGPCPASAKLIGKGARAFCIDVYEYPGEHALPRTAVTLAEAGRLCAARGERLCSEHEWGRACREAGGYPYGATYIASRCNTRGDGVTMAGSFPECRSPAGIYDLSGNAAEWVASGAQMGGSATSGARGARCSAAVHKGPPGPQVGFRCCADPIAAPR